MTFAILFFICIWGGFWIGSESGETFKKFLEMGRRGTSFFLLLAPSKRDKKSKAELQRFRRVCRVATEGYKLSKNF